MDISEKFRLFTKQHNSHWNIRYGEVEPFSGTVMPAWPMDSTLQHVYVS
jgi:hypothetical protein